MSKFIYKNMIKTISSHPLLLPMASGTKNDQLMRKPIAIEYHAQVTFILNDEIIIGKIKVKIL